MSVADYLRITARCPLTGRTGRRAYVVDPQGLIRCVPVTPRSDRSPGQGGIVNETPGTDARGRMVVSIQIDDYHRRAGWEFLEVLCRNDPDPEIAEKAYKIYVEWCNQGRRGRVAPLADEWYPAEVLARRERASKAATVGVYTAPRKRKRSSAKRIAPDLTVEDPSEAPADA